MFVNTSIFFTVSLAAIAAAVPANPTKGGEGNTGGGNCNANALCCDNVGSYGQLQDILGGLLGLGLNALTGNLGIGCVNLDIVDLLGDSSCNAQAVCCQGTTFANEQLIGLDCDAINIL
ncbi:hypothetical protein EV401DRAFT_1883573 [Pisolithus croceorrhizus]|nr:hypothetical protein EV401DRAFT_1883573 [Pisolithus croceorrhizus]